MKSKRVFKLHLRVLVICVSVLGVIGVVANLSEFRHWLPTRSKAGELRVASVASNGGSLRGVSIE